MMKEERPVIRSFNGLNNVADALALDLSWFRKADNCIVTDRKKIKRAGGFVLRSITDNATGAYVTKDQQRLFLVDDGQLVQVNADFSRSVLAAGLSSAPMRYVEVNGLVYYTNGVDFGVIQDGRAQPWGIAPPSMPRMSAGTGRLPAGKYQACYALVDQRGVESGASDIAIIDVPADSQIVFSAIPQLSGFTTKIYVTARNAQVFHELTSEAGPSATYNCTPDQLGMELPFPNSDVPRGTLPAFFDGQMYVAEVFAFADASVIWPSQDLHYHHFYYGDGMALPGQVRLLRGFDDGLVIGTDRQIHLWDGEKLTTLAEYGVTAGRHDDLHRKQLYFWSLRGVCRALPFQNLTEGVVSVAAGASAGAAVVEQDGFRRYLVALQKSGTAYNMAG